MRNRPGAEVLGSRYPGELLKTLLFLLPVLFIVPLFFYIYNSYFVDSCLKDLELSLYHARSAADISDLKPVSGMLDSALTNELSSAHISQGALSYISVCRNVLNSGAAGPVNNVTAGRREFTLLGVLVLGLNEAITAKKSARPVYLKSCDAVFNGFNHLATLTRAVMNRLFNGPFSGSGAALESAQAELKEGNLYEAEKLLRRVMDSSVDGAEIDAAKTMLYRIGDVRRIDKKIPVLQKKSAGLNRIIEKQEILVNLGLLEARRMNFTGAEGAFKEAVSVDPSSGTAVKAKFELGWLYKLNQKEEESLKTFQDITVSHPSSDFFQISLFQVADILKSRGFISKSITLLNSIYQSAKDTPLGSVSRLKLAEITFNDLKDTASATAIFNETADNLSSAGGERRFNPVYVVIAGLAFASAVLLLGSVVLKDGKKCPAPKAGKETNISPCEKAFCRLGEIKNSRLIEQGRFRDFYFQVSECLRRYLEQSLGINAAEMTTEEFAQYLRQDKRLTEEQGVSLEEFFKHCDRVKFAKYQPSENEVNSVFQKAYNFVNKIR